MPPAPYQPSLLRLLHGLTALLVGLCWFTGLALYSQFDGRWGRIPLRLPEVIDLHGSLGLVLLLVSLPFGAYAVSLGRGRLSRAAKAAPLLAPPRRVPASGLPAASGGLAADQRHGGVAFVALLRRDGPALAASIWRPELRPGDRLRHWPSQVQRFFGFSSSPWSSGPSD